MILVFWYNIVSPHQAPFLRALASKGHDVTVVTTEMMTPDRVALGWQVPDIGGARLVIAPGTDGVQRLINECAAGTIQVLAGARWTALGRQATRECVKSRQRIGILSEAPDQRGLGGVGRRVKYTAERVSSGRHFDFVLAMGKIGVDWFHLCGYAPERVFSFGYVTDGQNESSGSKNEIILSAFQAPSDQVRLLFVGQIVCRKGVDLLFRAFAQVITSCPLSTSNLALLGDGPEKPALHRLAQDLGIAQRIVWLGQMNRDKIPPILAEADVLVLPSRMDGWGAVVNEALMAGTPVICSNACGAADLVTEPWRGEVFRAGSISALAAALRRWITAGQLSQPKRKLIQAWSTAISGEAVAEYFLGIMRHIYEHGERPTLPWKT